MKLALALAALAALAPISSVLGVNFVIIQPDDMDFYEEWNPPAFLPWANSGYPGMEYPGGSNLPWINKLRTDGLEMTQAYAASPKCATSRYSTVTGRYASRSAHGRNRNDGLAPPAEVSIPKTKLRDMTRVDDGMDCSKGNIAQVFRKNGFKTGMVGKWHLSNEATMADVIADIQTCGFEDVEAMYPDNIGSQPWTIGIHHNMEYVAYKAVEFIEDNQNEDFFLYVNPTVPHGPSVEEAMLVDCRATVDGDFSVPGTPGYPGEGWNVTGMTAAFGGSCTAYRDDVKVRAQTMDDADLGSIWVDDAVGAIYQALERTGQLANTVILFQLDHGKVNKDEIWEGGIRIPQFIHYPNVITTPTTFDGLVSTIDIGPTMLDFAGIDESNAVTDSWYSMDGKSWKGAISVPAEGDDWKANRCLFFESSFERAVRCGCDKLITLSPSSPELANAVANIGQEGWSGYTAATTEVYADLCGRSNQYIVAEDNPNKYSPEADNEIAQEPLKVADLRDMLNCHLDRTNQGPGTAAMDKSAAPVYTDCTQATVGVIGTPSPTVTAEPTLPVASDGAVPDLLDNDPLLDDIRNSHTAQILRATVLDDDLDRVRFSIQYPDGSTTGFTTGTVVATSGHRTTHELSIDTTGQPGKYGYRIRMQDNSGNSITLPASGFVEFFVADTASDIVDCARGKIATLIEADQSLAAKFLRHGFHDCVGGCDGCVNMNDPDNAGLDIPILALRPVVDLFAIEGVTRADIWALAALEGARIAQPTPDPGYNRDFALEYYGRPTCDSLYDSASCEDNLCTEDRGPNGVDFNLPSPNLDTHELLDFFQTGFGFDERDTVAIMGAHSIGELARDNSGYDGPMGWNPQHNILNNEYYKFLVGGNAVGSDIATLTDAPRWTQSFVDNVATPDRWQWERNDFVMINSDIALVRDLSGQTITTDGEVTSCQFVCTRASGCPRSPQCPHAAATIGIVEEYKHQPDVFVEDFEAAMHKMLTAGEYTTPACAVGPCLVGSVARRSLRGVKL